MFVHCWVAEPTPSCNRLLRRCCGIPEQYWILTSVDCILLNIINSSHRFLLPLKTHDFWTLNNWLHKKILMSVQYLYMGAFLLAHMSAQYLDMGAFLLADMLCSLSILLLLLSVEIVLLQSFWWKLTVYDLPFKCYHFAIYIRKLASQKRVPHKSRALFKLELCRKVLHIFVII